jgi:DNA-binding IclR family transcriptional regulator
MALPQAKSWIDALVEAGDPPHGTQSIRRAFLILRVLSSAGDSGLGLSEISLATGLARPTAHRFLSALIAEGAVEQRPRTLRYSVAKTLVISGLTQSASPLLSAATSHLDEAAEDIGDTLFLTLRAGLDTICVARRLGGYPIQVLVLGVGVKRPIGFSSSGIALLASLSTAAARHILVQNRLHLRTNGATIESAIVAMTKARKMGYAFRERGIVPGTRAVSIAFGNRGEGASATLTVTAIARRMQVQRVKSIVDRMKVCAAGIEKSLGSQAGGERSRIEAY